MIALPLLKEPSKITLSTAVESSGYIDMTLTVLSNYKIKIDKTVNGFYIPADQKFQSGGAQE
jgi:3-phosphoshikimate 1-carboxyvinyltransferase